MRTVLVCLHGWGGDKHSFTELREALKDSSLEILTPDLPGFGDEPEPSRPWTTNDYADWTERWITNTCKLKIVNCKLLLLGHSHGGRIAMKLAARGTLPITHLYLCAAAGIRRPRHFKRIVGLLLAKSGKIFLSIPGLHKLRTLGRALLYKLVRVHDYEKASSLMQQTLMKVTQEDLRPLLSHIKVPTDIFWGSDDQMTPIADAHVIHKGIKGSRLHIYKGVRHRVHRERAREIGAVIISGHS
jgi:pimeloyl-ACP methyl ester carboxylesterase